MTPRQYGLRALVLPGVAVVLSSLLLALFGVEGWAPAVASGTLGSLLVLLQFFLCQGWPADP